MPPAGEVLLRGVLLKAPVDFKILQVTLGYFLCFCTVPYLYRTLGLSLFFKVIFILLFVCIFTIPVSTNLADVERVEMI